VYVPLSGTETLTGGNLDYECCKSRGTVVAMDANTGKVLWRAQSIQEPLRNIGENSHGKQMWGPAGASVWNTPTIDAKRKLIYVGTGNSFGRIAASTEQLAGIKPSDGMAGPQSESTTSDIEQIGGHAGAPVGKNEPRREGDRRVIVYSSDAPRAREKS